MSNVVIYLLQPVLDDPRFEGFGFASRQRSLLGNGSLEDDFTAEGRDLPKLAPLWKPPKVVGRVRQYNDFPCVDLTIPAFSQRAVHALRDMLEPNGELLPLHSDVGIYYAYRITTIVDALDRARSKVSWYDSRPNLAIHIWHHGFHSRQIQGLTAFSIPERPGDVYVSCSFTSKVAASGLQGFDCPRVWPLPPGVDWMVLHKQQRARRSGRGLKPGQTLKGQSLIIVLGLRAVRPSKEERRRVNGLLNELDRILVDMESTKPATGNLEGHEYAERECRIFLSCPDVAALVTEVRPLLEVFAWEGDLRAVARAGEYIDGGAPAQPVTIVRRGQ